MRRLVLGLIVLVVGCVSVLPKGEHEYYMTRQPTTIQDSTMLVAKVNLLDRFLFQSNYILFTARRHNHEEAACFPIRSDGEEFWITGFLRPATAYIRDHDGMTGVTCPDGYGMIHYHPFDVDVNGNPLVPCKPSPEDTSPDKVAVPVYLLACGVGVDSLIAYRVRKR